MKFDKIVQEKLAMDHLFENPKYYTIINKAGL